MRVENFILSSALVGSGFAREVDRNIYGKPLEKCDRSLANDPNWPITGFMRGNYCKATEMDRGSHYVCVNLPDALTDEGEHYSTFWTETGQAETPEEATTWPLAGPWCICEWAYARMVRNFYYIPSSLLMPILGLQAFAFQRYAQMRRHQPMGDWKLPIGRRPPGGGARHHLPNVWRCRTSGESGIGQQVSESDGEIVSFCFRYTFFVNLL